MSRDFRFGSRVANERRRLRLTQQQLGDRLGIGRAAVAMIEADRGPVYLERAWELGELGFDVVYLLSGETSRVAAGQLLDWKLALEMTERVKAWAAQRRVTLSPEKTALIVKLLYMHQSRASAVDEVNIEELLRAAA